ncbi:MAG: hypothetical protein NTW03_10475 [Verrucomicrobia bacterium]|nr:hypothetical protein [Verrucomicrobiota bacterium]MCX6922809.1 hypothetical protein [Verrucomicrobiota bacterium]
MMAQELPSPHTEREEKDRDDYKLDLTLDLHVIITLFLGTMFPGQTMATHSTASGSHVLKAQSVWVRLAKMALFHSGPF